MIRFLIVLAVISCAAVAADGGYVITHEEIFTEKVPNKLEKLRQDKLLIAQEQGQVVLNNLYSQYNIFQKIKESNGFKGEAVLQMLRHYRNEGLKKVIGRIFIIESNGELKSGTGVLLRGEGGWRVFTTKHNFKNPNGCLYYFVPAFALNLETGFLNDLPNKNFLKYILEILVNPPYTRVQRILVENLSKTNRQQVLLQELTQPDRLFRDEIVSCPYEKELPEGIENLAVEVLSQAQIAGLNGRYFAMGFSMLPQLYAEDTDIWSDGNDFACLAPLTITSTNTAIEAAQHQHHAPTTKGMSGGPIFAFGEDNSIKIIGLIRGGECINMGATQRLDFCPSSDRYENFSEGRARIK